MATMVSVTPSPSLEAKEALAKPENFGVAQSTWSSYRSAEKMLLLCQQETKINFLLPISRDNVLVFIVWLIKSRGVKGTTINSYLSGVRPITLNIMMLLKKLIRQWDRATMEKLCILIWADCTLALPGYFRIGEILCGREGQFDPDFALLTEDVTECLRGGNKMLSIKLKSPKETKTAAPTIVDVFESGGPLCLVIA
jgi:hypothetical protein